MHNILQMMFKTAVISILLLPALLSKAVYAGGGGAGSSYSDIVVPLTIIAVLGVMLGILYLVKCIRKRFHREESSPDEE